MKGTIKSVGKRKATHSGGQESELLAYSVWLNSSKKGSLQFTWIHSRGQYGATVCTVCHNSSAEW